MSPSQPRRPPGGFGGPASPAALGAEMSGGRPGWAAGEGGGHERVRWAGAAGRVPTHGELRRGLDDGRVIRAWKHAGPTTGARGRGPPVQSAVAVQAVDTMFTTYSRLKIITTRPTTLTQAAGRPRQPAVVRACR